MERARSVAWTLVSITCRKGTSFRPVYERDEEGNIKSKNQRRLDGDRWVTDEVPVTVQGLHRLDIEGKEVEVQARFTLLDRRYDRAIMRFRERNDLVCEWARHYSERGLRTVVVATRTPHVLILDAMLSPLL